MENNTKRKISSKMKGNKNFLGRRHSIESKIKMSNSKKGKVPWNKGLTKEIDSRIKGPKQDRSGVNNPCYGRCGELNPAWNNGSSLKYEYCPLWRDKEYKESIKERDGHRCLNPCCDKKSLEINIHHINYIKKDCRPKNLITLCKTCNLKANTNRDWHQSWYEAVIYRRNFK